MELGLRRLGWEVLPSAANFVFARPPEVASKVFAHLRKKKVLVRHFPGKKTGSWLRITVGTDKEIDFLLRALHSMRRARKS
jgi:histidinol-phosphate aminotransferase